MRRKMQRSNTQVERLVGILHVAEHGLQEIDTSCPELTVAAAANLARYFLAHVHGSS